MYWDISPIFSLYAIPIIFINLRISIISDSLKKDFFDTLLISFKESIVLQIE